MSVAPIHRRPAQPRHLLSVVTRTWAGAPGHLIVSVTGEVDAANVREFAATVCAAGMGARRVTLDLCGLDFFALDGVTALHAINARLLRADVPWCVRAGAAASRALKLCDPEGLIPLAGSDAPPPTSRRRPTLRLVR